MKNWLGNFVTTVFGFILAGIVISIVDIIVIAWCLHYIIARLDS